MKLEIDGIAFEDLKAFMNDLVMGHDLRTYRLKKLYNPGYCLLLTINKRYWLKTWKDTGCEIEDTNEAIETSFVEELQGQGHESVKVKVIG